MNAPAPCRPVIRASDEFSAGEALGAALGMAGGPALGKIAGAALRGAAGAISKGLGAVGRAIGRGIKKAAKSVKRSKPPDTKPASFPTDSSQTRHMFRDAPGHIADTPANRNLLQRVANDPGATLGTDRFGNIWSARIQADGTQIWVQTRNGIIQNAGVNQTPRTFNTQTGLSGQ